MVPEDLLFWVAAPSASADPDSNVLCRRHADAMVVPRGWTLEDRREDQQRLFRPRPAEAPLAPRPARRRRASGERPEQLQIDGTGELPRPDIAAAAASIADPYEVWQPEFDDADDLDGLLEVTSPLLARAFRGTDRPRGSSPT